MRSFDGRTGQKHTFLNRVQWTSQGTEFNSDPRARSSRLIVTASLDRRLRWLDNTTAICAVTPDDTFPGAIVRFDFQSGEAAELADRGAAESVRLLGILPGGEWAAVGRTLMPTSRGMPQRPEGCGSAEPFLLNLRTGERQRLALTPEAVSSRTGEWLSERYCVYSTTEGGISEIGTWLYDHQRGESRRLLQQPTRNGRLYLPDQGVILLALARGGTHLINLDGTEFTQIHAGNDFAQIRATPIDLGLQSDAALIPAPPAPTAAKPPAAADAGDVDGEVVPWLTMERGSEYLLIPTGRNNRPPYHQWMTVYHVPSRTVVAEEWEAPFAPSLRLVQDAPNHWFPIGVESQHSTSSFVPERPIISDC